MRQGGDQRIRLHRDGARRPAALASRGLERIHLSLNRVVSDGANTGGHKVPREIPTHDAKADYPRAEPFAFHNGAYASIEG